MTVKPVDAVTIGALIASGFFVTDTLGVVIWLAFLVAMCAYIAEREGRAKAEAELSRQRQSGHQ